MFKLPGFMQGVYPGGGGGGKVGNHGGCLGTLPTVVRLLGGSRMTMFA